MEKGTVMNDSYKWITTLSGVGSLGLALLLSPAVSAAEEEPEVEVASNQVIEQITVTATRVETNLMETAIAISALNKLNTSSALPPA